MIDGRLVPRHVDLRPFVFLGRDGARAHAARRPHARRVRRGLAGGQLVPERRRQGHVGAAVSRPLIGVTTSEVRLAEHTDPLPEGDPPQREMALGMVYMRAIELAGGIPVVLPPLGHDTIAPLLDRLYGVCLSGGPDIDPEGYGEQDAQPAARRHRARPRRLRARASRSSPTRAGCRCSASAAACRRSTSRAAARCTSTSASRRLGHRQTEHGRITTHSVRIEPGSRLARVMGVTEAEVNSFHHQAAERLGEGLRAVAWAPDGIVEGIESDGPELYLGVQWHAESLVDRGEHLALFRELVEEAAAYGQASGRCGRHERALGRLERRGPRGAVDGRHRGGGDAARAERVEPHLALGGGARGAAGRHDRAHGGRDARLGARAGDRAARRRPRARSTSCARLRSGLAEVLEPLGIRAAVAGTHPFTLWEDVEVSPGARYQFLYSSMRELARREPTFGAARARRGAEPRAGGARLQPRARAPADAARAVGQLAVLAGPRHRAVLDAHAALPGLPARRHPARVPLLRRLRRGHRRAAPLRRDPRADVPVVGRAAAAALRDARDPDHGRADADRPTPRRSPRSCSAWCGWRRSRATRATRWSRAPRCWTRTASSPRATAWRRS